MPMPLLALSLSALTCGAMGVALLTSRHHLFAAAALVLGATAVLLVHGLVHFNYYADDSYITLRYSRHLADGLGPNWNSDGRVEGYTSFLWMALLAGIGRLGLDMVIASRVLGFLATVATFLLIFALWHLWRDDTSETRVESVVVPGAAVLGLALVDGVAFWGFSGMETPLYMALLTGSAYLCLRERRRGGLPWSAIGFAATAMTRPEGLIAAALTCAFVFTVGQNWRARSTAALTWAMLFVLLYGSYFFWRYSYYGYLLPNTYYAKVGLTLDGLDRGLRYIATSGLQYHFLILFTGLAALATSERLRWDAVYVAGLCGTLVLAVAVEGGGDVHGRFVVPLLPLLLIGGLSGFATLIRRAALPTSHTMLVAGTGLVLAALALLPNSYDPLVALGPSQIEQRRLLGSWLNEHTPPDYTIADFQIGTIAYYGIDRNFLDLLGLNDVVIAHTHVDRFGAGVPGHEKYNDDYVLDVARPEIIILGQVHSQPLSAEELRPLILRSSLIVASSTLFSDPRLWERYEVRALHLNDSWYHFLQRKDSVGDLHAPGLQ